MTAYIIISALALVGLYAWCCRAARRQGTIQDQSTMKKGGW
jgi:hypothetical protein